MTSGEKNFIVDSTDHAKKAGEWILRGPPRPSVHERHCVTFQVELQLQLPASVKTTFSRCKSGGKKKSNWLQAYKGLPRPCSICLSEFEQKCPLGQGLGRARLG